MLSNDFAPLSRLADFTFLLDQVLKVDSRPWLTGLLSSGTRTLVLENADKLFRNVVEPLRVQGDRFGARFSDGKVTAPAGFAEAYRKIVDAGLHASTIPEKEGGIGLSPLLGQFIEEIGAGSNMALQMYYGFNASAVHSLRQYGDAWLADLIIPRLVSGEWVATMALTEPQAGSDLSQVRTRAVSQSDGTYRVTGDKIFISAGDHDMTDNIVHIVLARLQDEETGSLPGLSGLHVFVVPKFDFETGSSNRIDIKGIEHKMGLHGNPTCALSFDGSVGYRLRAGTQGSAAGMAPLFAMMNNARLSTGNGALGGAALAAEMTHGYALQRLSGRAPGSASRRDRPADPIIDHPDVGRMMLSIWSTVEGARATIAWVNLLGEEGRLHPDAGERRRCGAIAHLLTSLIKAFVTDAACEACDHCIQIYGGHGYIQDTGIEQFIRDGRITRIYEGANGIQAVDFVMRRLVEDDGYAIQAVIQEIRSFIVAQESDAGLATIIRPLSHTLDQCELALAMIGGLRATDQRTVLQCSTTLLAIVGLVLVGWRLAVSAVEARTAAPNLSAHKRRLAEHWAIHHAARAAGLRATIEFAGFAAQSSNDAAA